MLWQLYVGAFLRRRVSCEPVFHTCVQLPPSYVEVRVGSSLNITGMPIVKKIVPDPPTIQILQAAQQRVLTALKASSPTVDSTLACTTRCTFGPLDSSQQPMLILRAGISAQDALAHVSLLLLCAEQTSDEITELGSGVERGLIWSMVHAVEMARAVVESLLAGTAAKSVNG